MYWLKIKLKMKTNSKVNLSTYMTLWAVHRMPYWWNSLVGSNHSRYRSSRPRFVLPFPYRLVWNLHGFPSMFPKNSKSNSSWLFSNTSPFEVCYGRKMHENEPKFTAIITSNHGGGWKKSSHSHYKKSSHSFPHNKWIHFSVSLFD